MIGLGRKRAILIGTLDALIVIFSALFSLGLRFNFGDIPSAIMGLFLPRCLTRDSCFFVVRGLIGFDGCMDTLNQCRFSEEMVRTIKGRCAVVST